MARVFEGLESARNKTCRRFKNKCDEVMNVREDYVFNYSHLTHDQLEEVKGIEEEAKELGIPYVNMFMLLGWQIQGEIGEMNYCTGVVAARADGSMVHGRSFDFFNFPSGLKMNHGFMHVTYKRRGMSIFTSVQHIGQVGVHTGMRFGGYSIHEDTHLDILKDSLRHNYQAAKDGAVNFMPALRSLLEEEATFDGAMQRISTMKTTKPHFFVLSGAGQREGAIWTMKRGKLGKVRRLEKGILGLNWHMVQANDDHFTRPNAAWANLRLLGQNRLSAPTMMSQVMQKFPVLNAWTRFIYVMEPAANTWMLWDAQNPKTVNIQRSS